jgi:hypothetical protein
MIAVFSEQGYCAERIKLAYEISRLSTGKVDLASVIAVLKEGSEDQDHSEPEVEAAAAPATASKSGAVMQVTADGEIVYADESYVYRPN